jgi:DNA-binding PadR family transcriptional regulator
MQRTRSWSKQARQVFAAMLVRPRIWRYGYDLARETGLKSGTLYPLLMRLEARHLLESDWHESPERGRPPRHAYRLTADGRAAARSCIDATPGRAPVSLNPA